MYKKTLKLTLATAITLSATFAGIGGVSAHHVNGEITLKTAVNVRSSDNFSSNVVRVLPKGSTVGVNHSNNGMYQLGNNQWITANGKYVTYSDKKSSAASSNTTGSITLKMDVNVRSSASFTSRIVKVLKRNSTVNVLDKKNGMYYLGNNQWITANSKYVTYTSSAVKSAPSTTTPVSSSVETVTGVIKLKTTLNVRSNASFTSSVVRTLPANSSLKVYGKKNGLYHLGGSQWITANSKYVTFSSGSTNTSPIASPTPVSSTDTSKYENLISFGKQYMGLSYLWGGSTPRGFDCSGFIYYVMKQNGFNVSRTDTLGLWAKYPTTTNPQVGDLIFFKNTYRPGISHVGFYIGNGNFLHTASSTGVTVSNVSERYYSSRFAGYKSIR